MITVIDKNNLPVKYVKCEAGAEDMQCGIDETWERGIISVQNNLQNEIYETRLQEQIKKTEIQELISKIEVEYNGKIYQGDESSQSRISKAINGLTDDSITTEWKAKDNSWNVVTRIDLQQILFLACNEQTRILKDN